MNYENSPHPAPDDLVRSYVQNLRAGPVQGHGEVRILPLLAHHSDLEALSLGNPGIETLVECTEVSEMGRVSSVQVKNGGHLPLLLLDGELISGGKQQRTVDGSTLVAPGTCIEVPVLCVEQRRWRHSSDRFRSEGTSLSSSLKRRKLARTMDGPSRARRGMSEQAGLWKDVTRLSQNLGVDSPTSRLGDVLGAKRERIAQYMSGFECLEDQVGQVAWIRGKLVSADILGSASLYRELQDRVLYSVAAEAVRGSGREPSRRHLLTALAQELLASDSLAPSRRRTIEQSLRQLGAPSEESGLVFLEAAVRGVPSPRSSSGSGVGIDFRAARSRAVALVANGHTVHLSVFSRPESRASL